MNWLHQDKEKRRANEADDVDMHSNLEKGDIPAMLLSALLVIVPLALVALLIMALFSFVFFHH